MFAKRKTKRIEDIEKVVRNYCVDYYMNNDTTILKHDFGEDMLTYLFCYYNIIELVIREGGVPTLISKRLETRSCGLLQGHAYLKSCKLR